MLIQQRPYPIWRRATISGRSKNGLLAYLRTRGWVLDGLAFLNYVRTARKNECQLYLRGQAVSFETWLSNLIW